MRSPLAQASFRNTGPRERCLQARRIEVTRAQRERRVVDKDLASRTLVLTEVNTEILEAAREFASEEQEWEFLCECGRQDCHEHVKLTLDAYIALHDGGRSVLAKGHRLSQVDRARRLQADAEALRRQAQHQVQRALSLQRDRRMTALNKANEVRVARARLKRELRAGDARVEQILAMDVHPMLVVSNASQLRAELL